MVATDRKARAAEIRLIDRSAGHIDRRAGLGERLSYALPDAAASTGHQRDLSSQTREVVHRLPFQITHQFRPFRHSLTGFLLADQLAGISLFDSSIDFVEEIETPESVLDVRVIR
jgi:hypothetical protein